MVNPLYLVNAKSIITCVYALCDSADELGAPNRAGFDYKGTSLNTRAVFRHALTQFFLYLTVSDGTIKDEEIALLNELLDWTFAKEEVEAVITAAGINSQQFVYRMPDILPIMMKLDELVERVGLKPRATHLLIEAFDICGEAIIRVDGREDTEEKLDYESYVASLRRNAGGLR